MDYYKFTKIFKIERYKWWSSEFPEEYALIYTSRHDERRSSTFKLSVSREKVLCRLADNMCKYDPVWLDLKVSAERDSNGDCMFGKVTVAAKGTTTSQSFLPEFNQFVTFRYNCNHGGGYYTLKSSDETWEFSHNYLISDVEELRYYVCIECNKVKGLCVGFSGPFIYEGSLGTQVGKREVLGLKPPKAFIAKVENEFEEGEVYTLFQRGKGYRNGAMPVSVEATLGQGKARYSHLQGQKGKQNGGSETTVIKNEVEEAMVVKVKNIGVTVTGLVNNSVVHTQGHFNGCVFNKCIFYTNITIH